MLTNNTLATVNTTISTFKIWPHEGASVSPRTSTTAMGRS